MDNFPKGAAIVFGATGGIGRVVCLELARAGSDIANVWRSKEDVAKSLAEDIKSQGRSVSLHQCDVLIEGQAKSVIKSAATVNIEVHGFFDAAQAAILHMRELGGSIIHLGSAGDLSWPDKDVLSVAPKAANESLTKAIAREEGKNNIRANSVLIGVIEAGMFLELSKQGVFDEAWTEDVQKNLALKRWGQPEEVGHAVVFLASNKAAYVTGQQIAVAGGYGL